MSEENEFIDWQGGECPVDPDTIVEVMLSNGSVVVNRRAGDWNWRTSNSNGDIIAYRVVEPPKPKVKIPEGFTPWDGGERPIPGDTRFEMILRNGYMFTGLSSSCRWWHNNMHNDIIAYRVIEDDKPKTARDTQVGGDHYKTAGVQPWDVVDTWPIDQQIGFHRGNALKYVMRMETKDENLREIRKAAHYLQKLVEVLEQKGGV